MDLSAGGTNGSGREAPAPAAAAASPTALENVHAIGGVAPVRTFHPSTREEAADAVREAARARLPLVPWGGGIALSRERAPAGPFAVLDVSGLASIVRYEPDDFTVTAEAGVTIATLRETLASNGQELPLEAAEAWGATLGGVLAANASGARRRALGAPRDRVLGARFVTGDGVLARTGGMVVKNVAGHAVHRLLCGSRGGLATIVEASLKLTPRPLARAAMVWGADEALLRDTARWAGFARREPAVLSVIGRAVAAKHPVLASDAPFALIVGFEDEPAWVESQIAWARERLGVPRLRVEGSSAETLWQQLADFEEMPGPRLTFTTATIVPTALEPLLGGPLAGRLVFHAAAGRLHAWPESDAADSLAPALAAGSFARIEARGVAEPPGAPAPSVELRRRVRAALDPGGVMAFGERWVTGG